MHLKSSTNDTTLSCNLFFSFVIFIGSYGLNWSCCFIDACAWLGLAYDLKTVPQDIVLARVARTGDIGLHQGGHPSTSHSKTTPSNQTQTSSPSANPWGWGDPDIDTEHYKITQTLKSAHA